MARIATRRPRLLLPLALLALLLAAILATSAEGSPKLRIGLVLDNDYIKDPFEHGAYLGLLRASRQLGVEGKIAVPDPGGGDPRSAFAYLARQRYDLVVGLGFTQADSLDTVARKFPHVKFALLDASITDLRHRPRNVLGTHFKTEEGGYLAGYLAALLGKTRPGHHVVGSVGGLPIPTVDEFIAGYQAGARAADPSVRALNAYSDDFSNTAKCKALALQQIAAGASAVFQVADACGLGALAAAKERHVWGIGVDVDESFLGPHILTSVVKRLDIAMYDIVRSFRAGRYRGGTDSVFDLANGGVALGRVSPRVPRSFLRRLDRVRAEIVAGRIEVPGRL